MKSSISIFALTAALATAPLAFGADSKVQPKKPPQNAVKMSEAQLDNVTAGALINVFAIDVVDVNNNNVQVGIPVAANVAVQVLGGAIGQASQAGRVFQ